MSKTNDLRKVIKGKIEETGNKAYYKQASLKAEYPYCVFSFDSMDLQEINSDLVILIIDVWSKDSAESEDIADQVEKALNAVNIPTDTILPTFYRYSRKNPMDEDKTMQHVQLKFQIKNYERM